MGLSRSVWRRVDPANMIRARVNISCDETLIGRVLREEGMSHIPPRPQHPGHDQATQEDFKKRRDSRKRPFAGNRTGKAG